MSGHTSRVLHLAQSPDGTTVCSAAADETLRFWKCFAEAPPAQKVRCSCMATALHLGKLHAHGAASRTAAQGPLVLLCALSPTSFDLHCVLMT